LVVLTGFYKILLTSGKEDPMLEEFKKFIMRGNVLDLAVGVVMGAAFGAVVTSFTNDILMPPIGLLLGGVDFTNLFVVLKADGGVEPYKTLVDAQAAGAVTMNFGLFINVIISFLITAFALFLIIKAANRLQPEEEEAPPPAPMTKPCPYCYTEIPIPATRCPHCTSDLGE
jgi:large conductance mechanosensitive channel